MKTTNLFLASLLILTPALRAQIAVDSTDAQFAGLVQKELDLMRSGNRGVVCQELVSRLDKAVASTEIRPITSDEKTWHPNDRKGLRSHVMALDTKLRGAARTAPTNVIVYLHPNRIDPSMSLFKLGTFAHLLATALDLNEGLFSGDFKINEKRALFFRNAWRDTLKLELIPLSDRVPTLEYQNAKKAGLIRDENSAYFPILDVKTPGLSKGTP